MAERRRSSRPGRRTSSRLTHINERGAPRMVDVGAKPPTTREAVATGRIRMARATLQLNQGGAVKKGDPLQVARLAGIMAAKRAADLIPLCHPLPLDAVEVDVVPRADGFAVAATVRTTGRTGVEMEALTAVAVACLTIYDMVKAVDRSLVIDEIVLQSKRGGRSGEFVRAASPAAASGRRRKRSGE